MTVTYIHHSGFLVETDRFYHLFDYEKGALPPLNPEKPIFVLSSHSHGDHYNPEIFSLLAQAGMRKVRGILSDDITPPEKEDILSVSPGMEYDLGPELKLTTFRSTDLGVAFLMEDQGELIYHAGDLNDWVWEEETEEYNREMTKHYQQEIRLLAQTLGTRQLSTAFVVLDPRQEGDYHRGLCFFLENIPAKQVYPMHYWDDPGILETFLRDHPQYREQIQNTESTAHCAEKGQTMKFKMIHENYNVSDLGKSMAFYEKALGLKEVRRINGEGFIIVYMGNEESTFQLELTWLEDHPQAYDLGECEFHLAFQTDDYEAAHKLHEEMGCICFENPAMGIYFITDPDGYWLEILPTRKA